jgi:hypothetical protein
MIWQALTRFLVGVLAIAASWFGGRNAANADAKAARAEKNLTTALQAKEIENEVEALSTDTLKRRSRVWVRNPDR